MVEPTRARTSLVALVAVVLTAAVYAPALGAGFLADDFADVAYVARAGFPELLTDGLWGVPGGAGRYRPLLHLSAKLDWWLWGTSPLGWHVTDLLLHVACGLLFWRVVAAAARALGRSAAVAPAAALLWLVHPLHPEAVSWFAARGSVMAVLFALLALLALSAHRRRASVPRATAFVAAALAGFLSHESVLLLPVVAAALDALVLQHGQSRRARLRSAAATLALGLLAFGLCTLLRVFFVERAFGGDLADVLARVPPDERLGLVVASWSERARLLLVPIRASLLPHAWLGWAGFVVAAVAGVAALRWLRRASAWPAAIAITVAAAAFYLPSAPIVIRAADHANARQLYPLLLPWTLLLCLGATALPRWLGRVLLTLLVAGYAAATAATNVLWRQAAHEADRWAQAARAATSLLPSADDSLLLFEPPLARDGILILENATGALVGPPFYGEARLCLPITADGLRALPLVPEARQMYRLGFVVLRETGSGELQPAVVPPPGELEEGPWAGKPIATFDVAAVHSGSNARGIAILDWESTRGGRGEVVGWPLPGRGVLFPVGSDPEWLLAGEIRTLRRRDEPDAKLVLHVKLPDLSSLAPPDRAPAGRHTPPRFLAEAASIGPAARLLFLAWPGPVPIPAPAERRGAHLVCEPALELSTTGAFAWSALADLVLYRPELLRLYWCFEELDPLGRPVARSPLREIVPAR